MGKNIDEKDVVLKVEHLVKRYPVKKGVFGRAKSYVHALEDVSFELRRGETFAIVGESGCGKSTTGKCVLRLTEPTSGTVYLDGEELTALSGAELTRARQKMKLIFQDPYSSLNPRMTVADIIAEPIDIAGTYKTREERDARVERVMEAVGLDLSYKYRYPHEFSGGQRQRIGIARSLAVDPEFIVCDEPVSALDVSIQAQVVNMFEDLQEKLNVAYLFIAHDLLIVHHISDRIAVMYLGRMVEMAEADELMDHPIHPYTLSLLSAVPVPDPETARKQKRIILEGDVPSPLKMPSGCAFRTRCRYATERCAGEIPPLTDRGNGHMVACWEK